MIFNNSIFSLFHMLNNVHYFIKINLNCMTLVQKNWNWGSCSYFCFCKKQNKTYSSIQETLCKYVHDVDFGNRFRKLRLDLRFIST